jgi:hypothetical protein
LSALLVPVQAPVQARKYTVNIFIMKKNQKIEFTLTVFTQIQRVSERR